MPRFDYFVVFAEMRTGSNFLESNLNAFPGLQCHGEAFNPHFIGYPNTTGILGIDQAARDRDPAALIDRIRSGSEGLGGFRFFNDHDPRVLDIVLPDPRCAKIILTRNPAESYVSWKIAQATGQWKLTNTKHAKAALARFDAGEFERHLAAVQGFQTLLLNALQTSGQTAFYLAYEDLQDVEVMNGLAAWLGCAQRLEALDDRLKRQNPQPMSEKVENFAEMERALARLDRFDLSRTPNLEPRRNPVVPTYVAAVRTPLLYLPIRCGPEAAVRQWLAALDGGSEEELLGDFSQKTLRQWKRENTGHRGFTVLRHPVARAHAAFCEKILTTGSGSYGQVRQTLRGRYGVPLPKGEPGVDWTPEAHRAAFLGFLKFLKANLQGQTPVRVDACWASQASVIQGMGAFALPDVLLREEELAEELPRLAARVGVVEAPQVASETDPHRMRLAEIYDPEIETATRDAYIKDYDDFGFGAWA